MLSYLVNDHVIPLIFLAGMCGGFIADILNDNSIELPKKIGGKLFLGWIGGAIIGGFSGVLIDGSLITAFMGGFMGKEVIAKLTNVETKFIKNSNEKYQLAEQEVVLNSESETL